MSIATSVNTSLPLIMHIDLNSCFATIEQQANRLLRGRPVAVSAYGTPRGMVLASSYEAKRLGVKLGVNNVQARQLAPGIVILTPDPPKYREAHRRFRELLLEFTPNVVPKSIDEFVLDFSGTPEIRAKSLELGNDNSKSTARGSKIGDRGIENGGELESHCERMEEVGRQIKQRIKECLGEWVTVNVGIGSNRFLAKYAAGFNKPDGMTTIHYKNLESFYQGMDLVDLPGINVRYSARLRARGIGTPLEFLRADALFLKKMVFQSVVGHYWWARLRGHEVDDRVFSTKSIGHQYALPQKTIDKNQLSKLLMKLSEKVGRRLRKKDLCARGIHLYLGFSSAPSEVNGMDPSYVGFDTMHQLRSWHRGQKLDHRLYATEEVFQAGLHLLNIAEIPSPVRIMAVTVYGLEPYTPEQLSMFDVPVLDKSSTIDREVALERHIDSKKRLARAVDDLNDRYGEFSVVPAMMMNMNGTIIDRIAFGALSDNDPNSL